MLVLHHTHQIKFPSINSSSHMTLGDVVEDHDELIESIEKAREDDTIQLENTPNIEQLDAFWTGVQDDLKHDPTWYDFAEE